MPRGAAPTLVPNRKTPTPMTSQILGMKAEGFKRLTLVELRFDDTTGTYALMGANEAGKSSTIDALESVIKAPKIAEPIHKGSKEARVIVEFDDLIATRIYKPNGTTTITVTPKDGSRMSATELQARLFNSIALDPLAFSRLSEKEQVDQLLPVIGVDPGPVERARQIAFDARTVKGREKDSAIARRDAMPVSAFVESVDVAALTDELAAALGSNSEIDQASAALASAEENVAALSARVGMIDAQIKALQDTRAELFDQREKAVKDGAEREVAFRKMQRVDVVPIREKIDAAEQTNRAAAAERERVRVSIEADTLIAEHEGLTAQIKQLDADKATMLAGARMPIAGLAIDPERMILTMNGTPFAAASTGVKIRTGVAIAMALQPDLRLIIIRDASLLDQSNRDVIDALGKANDYLILLELADESSPVGVVFEDGAVKEVRS